MADVDPNIMVSGHDGPDPSAALPAVQRAATRVQLRCLGLGLVTISILLAYLLLLLWSIELPAPTAAAQGVERCILKTSGCFYVTLDVKLFLIVMVMGGLGSFVHTATSFGDFVGNERLTSNWIWWYILRPFLGMALAAIFYLAIRGGFLSVNSDANHINLYGIAAMSGLVGMFSKQATDKLSEVFNTLFKTSPDAGDSSRKGDLTNPVPVLSSVTPANLTCDAKDMTLVLGGTGFISASAVRVNGANRSTEFKQETILNARLLPEDLTKPGPLSITVFNPAPGGGASAAQPVIVSATPVSTNIIPLPNSAATTKGATDVGAAVAINESEQLDGCGSKITAPTSDQDLPAAIGGVAS